MNRACGIGTIGVVLPLATAVRAANNLMPLEMGFELRVRPFLKQYCVRCLVSGPTYP